MRLSTAWLAAFALLVPAGVAAQETLELPTTFDRVWYRGGKKLESGGKRRTGDLTITAEGLEFSSPKGEVVVPFASLRAISLGRITGDVDTDWVVLAVGRPGTTRIVSFRDGAKMGYGKRTLRIYDSIRETLRSLGAGPYDVPDGFETYDRLSRQFTLAMPSAWNVHHESAIEVDGRLLWGRIIFSPQLLGFDPAAMQRIEAGLDEAITLDRREASDGMLCNGFSRQAERRLVEWFAQDPVLAGGREMLEGPSMEPFPLGDCIARRLSARVRDESGADIRLDVRAVSDDETIFLFVLRRGPARPAEALARFELAVASFEPAPAR